jgi:hypothetical protein
MISQDAPELGFGFKSIARGVKKVGKGAIKVNTAIVKKTVVAPTKFAVKTNVALAKMSAKLALLPLKYLIQAARKIGQTLCQAPPQLLEMAAAQANVDPAFIPVFCTAVRENKFSLGSVRRLLPPALKVASKMAAAGMFPPIVPALAVVKRLPYVGKFAGPDDVAQLRADFRTPAVRNAIAAMGLVALIDYSGGLDDSDAAMMGLGPSERAQLRSYLAGEVGTADDSHAIVLGGVTVALTGLGFYLLFR